MNNFFTNPLEVFPSVYSQVLGHNYIGSFQKRIIFAWWVRRPYIDGIGRELITIECGHHIFSNDTTRATGINEYGAVFPSFYLLPAANFIS